MPPSIRAGDVRMFERPQYLPLIPEPANRDRRLHVAADKLDGYPLAEFAVGPHRQLNRAHSSEPQIAHNLISAHASARND